MNRAFNAFILKKSNAQNVCDFSQDDTLTFFHVISFQFLFSFDS